MEVAFADFDHGGAGWCPVTQTEFDGMAMKAFFVIVGGFVTLWGFFKTFATQKDFDKLTTRVDGQDKKQHESEKIAVRLETTIENLEQAVRDLTAFLRGRQHGPSCPAPLPYVMTEDRR